MIRVRPVAEKDAARLERISQIPGFFNLAGDREELLKKIQHSRQTFAGKIKALPQAKYLFAAADPETDELVGSSMIVGQHGTPDSPHFYFQVGQEKRYSKSTKTGFIHTTLTLGQDIDGPTELASLVVDPSARKFGTGKILSFTRFLFLAQFPTLFKDRLIAELLPPLNRKGLSPLWEALGRRFTNMDYWEADLLCSKNKEFILSLFPKGKIYATLFSPEARNAIGGVSKDTEAAMHLLTSIGFRYPDQIDPFDGGPHLHSGVGEITLLHQIETREYRTSTKNGVEARPCLLARKCVNPSEFETLGVACVLQGNTVVIKDPAQRKRAEKLWGLKKGDEIRVLPLDLKGVSA